MHHNPSTVRAILRAAQITAAFEEWLRSDGDRLVAAAELLGGASWKARASAVVVAAAEGIRPHELVRDLSDLSRLLSLELTDDLDSEEAACFILVHPDDPRADDARLCCEAVQRGLTAMRIVAEAESSQGQEAA